MDPTDYRCNAWNISQSCLSSLSLRYNATLSEKNVPLLYRLQLGCAILVLHMQMRVNKKCRGCTNSEFMQSMEVQCGEVCRINSRSPLSMEGNVPKEMEVEIASSSTISLENYFIHLVYEMYR